jgi:hypothetical protein
MIVEEESVGLFAMRLYLSHVREGQVMIRSAFLGNELELRISQPLSFLAEGFFFFPRPVVALFTHHLNIS